MTSNIMVWTALLYSKQNMLRTDTFRNVTPNCVISYPFGKNMPRTDSLRNVIPTYVISYPFGLEKKKNMPRTDSLRNATPNCVISYPFGRAANGSFDSLGFSSSSSSSAAGWDSCKNKKHLLIVDIDLCSVQRPLTTRGNLWKLVRHNGSTEDN